MNRTERLDGKLGNVVKLICPASPVWSLPQTVANAFKQRRLKVVLDEFEVERLDRIRNPSKHRGMRFNSKVREQNPVRENSLA